MFSIKPTKMGQKIEFKHHSEKQHVDCRALSIKKQFKETTVLWKTLTQQGIDLTLSSQLHEPQAHSRGWREGKHIVCHLGEADGVGLGDKVYNIVLYHGEWGGLGVGEEGALL